MRWSTKALDRFLLLDAVAMDFTVDARPYVLIMIFLVVEEGVALRAGVELTILHFVEVGSKKSPERTFSSKVRGIP